MAKVFISYSRKDIEFAKRLTAELQKSELDFWIDWEGIPPTVDWWKEIEKGIEEADAFLFLISPDSAKSKICGQEIDTAVKNGKRIIPIVVREIEWQDTPPQLGHLNYIFFSRDDDFDKAAGKLLTAIHTDYEWAASHRRLQVKALEWERNSREGGFLLRSKELFDAETNLARNVSKEPHPTHLQREYVLQSRKATDKQRKTVQFRWISIIGMIVVAIALVFLALLEKLKLDLTFIYHPLPIEWVNVPAGEFPMGRLIRETNDSPVHSVTLTAFDIGMYEVTNKQYLQCVRAKKCDAPLNEKYLEADYADYPVTDVNWFQADAFCKWNKARLPTEAEWEKAARGTDARTYPWGEEIDNTFANYNTDPYANPITDPSSNKTDVTPVGSYEEGRSPYGAYDMAGNAMEWVADWFSDTYYTTYYPEQWPSDPTGPDSGVARVLRGGSWRSGEDMVSSTYRYGSDPSQTNFDIGFRCARSLP